MPPPRGIPHERLVAMIADLQARGLHVEQTSVTRFVYHGAGKCQSPVVRELYARPSPSHRDPARAFKAAVKALWPGSTVVKGLDLRPSAPRHIVVHAGPGVAGHKRTKVPLALVLNVKCRRCDNCRRLRAYNWSMRAKHETQIAPRTWFGTLTLRPGAHAVMVSRARVRLVTQGIDFDALPYGEQFVERHKEISREITKYLKRVRKQSSGGFRYLLVAEHHQSGLPHYHLLLHEQQPGNVKHAVLSAQWQLGFEKWRVVDDLNQATYLCKYLSKATVARVRASISYGDAPQRMIDIWKGRHVRENPGSPMTTLDNSLGVGPSVRLRLPCSLSLSHGQVIETVVINKKDTADSVFGVATEDAV